MEIVMNALQGIWEGNRKHFLLMLGLSLASATLAILLSPRACAEERGPRHFVISDRPMSDGVVEIFVDEVPLDVVLRGLWEKSPELSRGVMVVGGRTPPLVSIRYVGSLRDLDYALDELIDAQGWTRRRTLRGVDILAPKSASPRVYRPAAAPAGASAPAASPPAPRSLSAGGITYPSGQ